MAVMGLAGVLRGKKVRTTVSRKTVAAGDRVNRQFVAERPDQLWVADFTYGVPGVQGGHGCLNEPRVCLEYCHYNTGGYMTLAELGMAFWHDLAAPVIAGILASMIVSWLNKRK